MITGLYAGISALVLAFFYLLVVIERQKNKVSIGDGGSETLARRIRIHGNFIETVPFLLILLFLMENHAHSVYVLHVFGSLVILSRLLSFYGLRNAKGGIKARVTAGVLTNILFIIGGLILISDYVTSVIQ
jgi:uncharacterized membrane protein YecN with MAPEG domain